MKQFKKLILGMFILLSTGLYANTVNMAPIITYLLSDTTAISSGLDIIKAYADDQSNPVPTVQDYEDAGVVGVTLENIDDINETVASLTSSDVDTTEEIQAIVDDINNNTSPIANAGIDQNVTIASTVTLDGSESSDEEDDLLTYLWSMTSKPEGSTATLSDTSVVDPTFIADVNGSYTVQLIVNDGMIDSTPDSVTVQAKAPNTPPSANAGADQNVNTGTLTTLDGALSDDADNDPLTYSWTFISVPAGSTLTVLTNPDSVNPTFISDVDGEYTIQLIVNDGEDDSIPDTVRVTTSTVTVPVIEIKKTEQTKSYDVDGNEVTDGTLKDDGFYQKGVTPSYGRDDLYNIVTDHITGLVWQDDVAARTVKTSLSGAETYCDTLVLGTYDDWRVPTIVELQSIIVQSKYPSIDTSVFLNYDVTDMFGGRYYWSSTLYTGDTGRAWLVQFLNGRVSNYNKYDPDFSIRCVR